MPHLAQSRHEARKCEQKGCFGWNQPFNYEPRAAQPAGPKPVARNPLPVSSVRGSAAGAGPPPLARGRQPGHAVAVSSARGGVAQRACLRHPDTVWAPPCEKGHGGEAQCLPSSPGPALSGTPWGLRAQTQPIGLPWRNAPGGSSPGAHPGKPSPPPPPRVGPAAASRARLAARWIHTGLSAAAAVLLEAKQLGLPLPPG